jgi:hypothetical protein
MSICPFSLGYDGTGIQCIESNCKIWYGTGCSLTRLQNLYGILSHDHSRHKHEYPHNHTQYDESVSPAGSATNSTKISLCTILAMEYNVNQDQDGNGKVYGFDFVIKDDGNKPPALQQMESSTLFPTPSASVSWSTLLAWYLSGGTSPI